MKRQTVSVNLRRTEAYLAVMATGPAAVAARAMFISQPELERFRLNENRNWCLRERFLLIQGVRRNSHGFIPRLTTSHC